MSWLGNFLQVKGKAFYTRSIVGVSAFLLVAAVYANPVLDHVAAGQATVEQTTNSTVVNQTSQKAIINWQSFNIGASETTHFQQPAGRRCTKPY